MSFREWMLYPAIAWTALVLACNIQRDYRYWLRNRATNHNNRFFIRMWCLIPAAIGFTLAITGPDCWHWISALYLSIASLMIAFVWANLFSGIRNVLCGERWHFAGSDGPEDGTIENLLQRRPWLQWVKVGTAILLTILYIKLWN